MRLISVLFSFAFVAVALAKCPDEILEDLVESPSWGLPFYMDASDVETYDGGDKVDFKPLTNTAYVQRPAAFGGNKCYDATLYDSVSITAYANQPATMTVAFTFVKGGCAGTKQVLRNSATLKLTTSPKTFKVKIPTSVDKNKFHAVRFHKFSSLDVTYAIQKISLVGSETLCQNVEPVPILKQCKEPGMAALTYDESPNPNGINLVNHLKSLNVPAAFFLMGGTAYSLDTPKGKAYLNTLINSGIEIGNNGCNGEYPSSFSVDMNVVLAQCLNGLVFKAIGKRPAFYRPFGDRQYEPIRIAAAMTGMSALVMYNLEPPYSHIKSEQDRNINRFTNQLSVADPSKESYIINVTPWQFKTRANLTTIVVDALKNRGFRFVSLSECLGMPAYQ